MVKLENRNTKNIVETHTHRFYIYKHIYVKNSVKRGHEFIRGERGIHKVWREKWEEKIIKKIYYYLKTKNK